MLRLRASIVGIEPEIWRTIDVDDSLTLAQLHVVLQAAFGWQNSHLHRFTDGDPWASRHGIPRIGRTPRAWVDVWSLGEGTDEDNEEDEADTTVREAFEHDGPLWYTYDMGDSWIHEIQLIDRDTAKPGEPVASIVIGERRAPFEDSGGVGGYVELVDILADPSHPRHREMKDWAEGAAGFWGVLDPEDADLAGAQAELAQLLGSPAFAASDPWSEGDPSVGLPIAHLAADLPVYARWSLVRHLGRTNLLDAVILDEQVAAEMVAPFTWLLGRVGPDGMTLTKAGWMPPAAVLEGMTELGWREWWIGEANREDQTYPMQELRAAATQLRLIRKVKGRLEVVARVRKAADRPELLVAEIARMLLRQRLTDTQRLASALLVLGIADGSITTRGEAERSVLWKLDELGYSHRDGRPMDWHTFAALVDPVLDVLITLGLWGGREHRRSAPVSDAMRTFARMALL